MTNEEINRMAEEIADTAEEYQDSDPAEVVEELVRIYAADEELTYSDEARLRDAAWDMVNDRRSA